VKKFWDDGLGTYALALDGEKRRCRVATSNAGHALFTGIAPRRQAARVARDLLSPRFFSGWGVRTLAAGEPRYNPMSYHNGSIWPHDNSIAAAGLARYCQPGAAALLHSMLAVAAEMELHRLPELFCGFDRQDGEGPVRYPVAGAPQAWACGAVFQLLQACLGLRIDGRTRTVTLRRPEIPAFLGTIEVSGLRVGDTSTSLAVESRDGTVSVHMLGPRSGVRVVVAR
jgi:glycogen debranching enzyme